MAELATIARPYAEALFKAGGGVDGFPWKAQLEAVAGLAADPQLRQFADSPKVAPLQVFDLIAGIATQKGLQLDQRVANLLQAVIENGRLAALPEISAQYSALVNAQSGSSDATVYSAFPIDDAALADVVATLEKRFGRKLKARVEIDADLIGGIRVVVGDEVLDTSVKARLEQMKVALTA
jgi:F-type H+-transporting ATPase subunit delta